jgi:hypothetical protein
MQQGGGFFLYGLVRVLDVLAHSVPGHVLLRASLALGAGTQSGRFGSGQRKIHGHAPWYQW